MRAPCRPGTSSDLAGEPSAVLASSDALTVPAATARGATRWSAQQRLHAPGSTTGSFVAVTTPLGSHGWSHRARRRVLPVEAAPDFRRSAEVLTEVSGGSRS